MEIFAEIGEYVPAEQETDEEPTEENVAADMEMEENVEMPLKSEEHFLVAERVEAEIELTQKNSESNYNEILDHMVNIMSLKNLDIKSIYDAQDHVNKIISQIQLLVTELSVYTTEIVREWEKDKNKLVQLNSVLEIQKKLFSEQQIKMNAMKNTNEELENRLRGLESSLQRNNAIHQKAKELAEMTGSTSLEKLSYPYFR